MTGQGAVTKTLDDIGQTVAAGVDIGIVDLFRITGQDNFGAFTG